MNPPLAYAGSRATPDGVRVREVVGPSGVRVEVNLSPNAACPFACDTCEVPRVGAPQTFPEPVDLRGIEGRLRAAFERHGEAVREIVFAGPGEPTWSPQFEQALTIVLASARCLAPRPVPVRVLTCGTTLERDGVRRALEELVRSGEGEVWVKLDAWDEESFGAFNGGRLFERAMARIVRLARRVPVVLCSTVARRKRATSAEELGAHLERAVRELLDRGACIERVELRTIARGTRVSAGPSPLSAPELARVAAAIATAVPVRIAAA